MARARGGASHSAARPGSGAARTPRAIRSFAIADHVPSAADGGASADVLLVCPWLRGLPPQNGLWLSILPIHDSNAYVEEDWRFDAPADLRRRCYFGVFSLDRLRAPGQLLTRLRRKGVRKLINLPSVSFFDAASAHTLDMLGFTPQSERAFLRQARDAGFCVALCAHADAELSAEERSCFDFVLTHGGAARGLAIVQEPALNG